MFQELGIPWGLPELHLHYSPDWYTVYRAAGIPNARWTKPTRSGERITRATCGDSMRGTRRVLAQLARRHRLGLVTSGDRNRVTRQLREYRLTTFTRASVGDTANKKPHPEPLLKALNKMKLDPRECVYVGDTPEDLQMARAAGVCAIAVLWLFPTETKLRAELHFLLEKLEQLPGAIAKVVCNPATKNPAITLAPDFPLTAWSVRRVFAAAGVGAAEAGVAGALWPETA